MRTCKTCGGRVVPSNFSVGYYYYKCYYCYKCGSVKHSDIYIPIKKGTKVKAKDDLKMNGSSLVFAIKDKIYSISKIKYELIDEQGSPHIFSEDFIREHFEIL